MIVGNSKIQTFLNRSFEKGLIAQAYVFAGPEEVGKRALALEFAEKLTGKSENRINPDILVVTPQAEEKKGVFRKKDIGVGEIREAQNWLSLTPQSGERKVVIIDEGERMKKSAQNALLKTLEDTPKGAVLIIITCRPEALLATIVSRVQLKKFFPVSDEELSQMIPADHPGREELIFWSMGRPGRVRNFLEDEGLLLQSRNNQRELSELLSCSIGKRLEQAEIWAKNIPLFLEKSVDWIFLLRQAILGKKQAVSIDSKKAFLFLEKFEVGLKKIKETNANPRLILENLFLSF